LAILKHISSKNANYGDAEKYLLFEHDEFTMKPTLDAAGRLIPRAGYRISSLNCDGEDFAIACMRANLRYGKNQKREDVKSHHYIISFDPRDGPENGLTVDRAQELGEKFCREHFPGHQALVCTHPDGHNGSGNIHVHIVINSLRIAEVPLLPHMDRPADRRAGCKHRCTDACMNYLKAEVMEMCHREGLYQKDLLNGSKERITEREYWAQKKGQLALDSENAARAAEKPAPIAEYPGTGNRCTQREKSAKIAPKQDGIQRMVDREAKRAEGKGAGYDRWAAKHNLKQMAATLAAYQNYGFSSPNELDAALDAAHEEMQESLAGLKELESALAGKKELQRNLLSYIGTKPARDGLKAQKSDKARRAYREQHESDFIIAESAARYFKEHEISKLPKRKELQEEIQRLTVEKNAGYNDYRAKRERFRELQTVKGNIDQILHREPSRPKKHEQER